MDDRLADRVRESDLVLAIGGRLGEVPTRRYTLLEPPRPHQVLIHVHPDPDELGSVYEPDLPIVSGLPEVARQLRGLDPVEPRWSDWTRAARADYEANLRHEPMEGAVDLGEVMAFLRSRLPGDAIQTCGAGNFTVWAHRFAEFTQYGTQVCPRSGSMGYGVAAAVAAKLVHPDRIALCFTGDGDFVMSSPEFATAVQYELPIVVLLVNNGMYATIRMHQERQFPAASSARPSRTRTFRHSRRPTAVTASESSAPRTSRPRSSARSPPASRRCSSFPSIPSASARGSGSASSEGGRMSREEIRVDGLAEPISHFTDAVRAGNLLFVSGIVPVDSEGALVGGDDVVAQTRQVFENMRAILAAAGCGFEDVVKVTVFLTNVDDRPLINPVRQEVFGSARPASTLVEVSRLVVPGAKVEIEAVALVP